MTLSPNHAGVLIFSATIMAPFVLPAAHASPGDLNCDAQVNGQDIGPFATALLAPSSYAVDFPDCNRINADLNCDGDVTTGDILAFADCLLAGHCEPCGIEIELVTVGNPGNPGRTENHVTFGRVDYVYQIGKYEITAGQYAAFLNAVAATDTYALYHTNMSTHDAGCRIERDGSPGSYTYTVAPDWANRPVNFVSFTDAVRFANWLHNGQPAGMQDLSTTEDGSYFLNGITGDFQFETLVREPDATWVIPTENEWYKAAYHKNDGVTGNYWSLPTGTDSALSNDLVDPDPGRNATYQNSSPGNSDFTVGPPYWRSEVGAHENSASPYGTFDQGGNVQEFNETVPEFDIRGIRGGSWFWGVVLLYSYSRPIDMHTSDQFSDLGFRVARIP